MNLGAVLVLAILVLTIFLAVVAIKRGYTGAKKSKAFDTSGKKIKLGYQVVSIMHMVAGIIIILIILCLGIISLSLTGIGG